MIYGKELIIDFKFSNKLSRQMLKDFVKKLCKKIEMKRYGECKVIYFGKDRFRGYSIMQFITTSSIVGHLTDNEGYLNIFSCKDFDKGAVIDYIKEQFKVKSIRYKLIKRVS